MTNSVLAVIRLHVGKRNAIKGRQIAAQLGIEEAEVREAVNTARCSGEPIASDVRVGYFMATTPEELDHTIGSFRSRINAMTAAYFALRTARAQLRRAA